jgi:uncharacterized RDD family membrane protein YckC
MTPQTESDGPEPAPEVVRDIHPASLLRRAAAVVVDTLIVVLAISVVGALIAAAGLPSGVAFAAGIGIWFAYWIVWEGATRGLTPGKRMFDIQVVRLDGGEAGWSHSIVRNLLRVVDVLPTAYIVGGAVSALTRRSQRIGDLVGHTIVVDRRSATSR